MTRSLSPAVSTALEADALVPRDFLWVTVRDRATPANTVDYGFWSGAGNRDADVVDAVTGATVTRTFEGAGSLIRVSAVPMVQGFVIQDITIEFSQIAAGTEAILRTYDLKQAPVQLYRGFLDPMSGLLVEPAQPRFMGFIDEAPTPTPEEGGEAPVSLKAVSYMQELTRTNPAKRSDADQKLRSATDSFYRHAATVTSWSIYWGQEAE